MPTAAPSATGAAAGTPDTAGVPVLAALVQPVGIPEFLGSHWPETPLAVHGPKARLPSPLNAPCFDTPAAFLSSYRGRVLFGRGSRGPRAALSADADPAALYAMGLTLYLPDVAHVLPECAAFLRALESDLGIPAHCARFTAWASPEADGAACHFDAEDVFSIQLAGRKRFSVIERPALRHAVGSQFGPGIAPPPELVHQVGNRLPVPDEAEFVDIDMEPGSVLYLPRGHWHRTVAEADSLSVTIAIATPTLLDGLLVELRETLLSDERWRRPVGGLPGAAEAERAILLTELPAVIGRLR